MLKVKSNTKYFAKKKALWLALRHLSENTFDKKAVITCIPESDDYKIFIVTFEKQKLINSIGFDFTNDYSRLINESRPGGKLYHKDSILEIYNKSIV